MGLPQIVTWRTDVESAVKLEPYLHCRCRRLISASSVSGPPEEESGMVRRNLHNLLAVLGLADTYGPGVW